MSIPIHYRARLGPHVWCSNATDPAGLADEFVLPDRERDVRAMPDARPGSARIQGPEAARTARPDPGDARHGGGVMSAPKGFNCLCCGGNQHDGTYRFSGAAPVREDQDVQLCERCGNGSGSCGSRGPFCRGNRILRERGIHPGDRPTRIDVRQIRRRLAMAGARHEDRPDIRFQIGRAEEAIGEVEKLLGTPDPFTRRDA